MRDELSHIRNKAEERRRLILSKHKDYLDQLFAKHPQLKENYQQIELVKNQIITMTIAKLRGDSLDTEVSELEQHLDVLRRERLALLKELKIEPSSLEPNWECRRCQDTGRVYIDEQYISCSCSRTRKNQLLREIGRAHV